MNKKSKAKDYYPKIYVGPDHHLAHRTGFAYKHRLVAEQKLGRRLRPEEVVHHVNHIKRDSSPENIEVLPSEKEHRRKHAKRVDLKPIGERNRTIHCACGCGCQIKKYDDRNRPRRFINGHSVWLRWRSHHETTQTAVIKG